MNARRPTFAIIGAARASTTAVAWALGSRPDVFVTEPKETHFWAFAGTTPRFTGPGDDEMINDRLVTDPQQYASLYDRAGAVAALGDGSVSTLYHSVPSIANLRTHAHPDVRLVCLVRHPAERARSAHLYLRSRGHEPLASFAEALDAEPDRIDAGWHHLWHYRGMSRYAEQLPAFVEAFGDRLLVLVAEEIRSDPVGFSDRVCAHLDIDPALGLDLSSQVNVGGEPRSRVASAVINGIRRSQVLGRTTRAVVPVGAREAVRRWSVRHDLPGDDPTDRHVMAHLRRSFAPDIDVVEGVLGRRVPSWH